MVMKGDEVRVMILLTLCDIVVKSPLDLAEAPLYIAVP